MKQRAQKSHKKPELPHDSSATKMVHKIVEQAVKLTELGGQLQSPRPLMVPDAPTKQEFLERAKLVYWLSRQETLDDQAIEILMETLSGRNDSPERNEENRAMAELMVLREELMHSAQREPTRSEKLEVLKTMGLSKNAARKYARLDRIAHRHATEEFLLELNLASLFEYMRRNRKNHP